MKKYIQFCFIFLLFSTPIITNAWGLLGHRIVGQIADSYLTQKTKTEITKILGFESIAMASNWPDFVKSDPAYKYLSLWHYVNLKPGLTFNEVDSSLNADTTTNAFTKTNFLIRELKTNKLLPTDKKILYLRLLIHIVGDLHQPMHLGRIEDRGGNAIKVKWFSDDVNLHQIWDEKLISFQELSYTEYAASINNTTLAQRTTWQKQKLTQWMYDTYQLSEKVYAGTTPDSRLDFGYNFKFIAPLNDQLLKGGVHLAGVLNDIFK
jgi:hypothetical protein